MRPLCKTGSVYGKLNHEVCLLGGTGVLHSNNARLRGVECRQPGFDGGGVGVGGGPGYSCHGYRVAMETSPGHTALYSLAVCTGRRPATRPPNKGIATAFL